jgi:hypothetical protein
MGEKTKTPPIAILYSDYVEVFMQRLSECVGRAVKEIGVSCHALTSWLVNNVKTGASSFSRPLRKSSSRRKRYPSRTPPSFCTSDPAAAAEPPKSCQELELM